MKAFNLLYDSTSLAKGKHVVRVSFGTFSHIKLTTLLSNEPGMLKFRYSTTIIRWQQNKEYYE